MRFILSWVLLLLGVASVSAQTQAEVQKFRGVDTAGFDEFGYDLALSGSTAIVGAPRDDSGPFIYVGAAYIFRDDGTGNWSQADKLLNSEPAKEDFFGLSVAIDGNVAVVGAPAPFDQNARPGSAYVFRPDSGGDWSEVGTLLPNDGVPVNRFGYDVDVSGNTAVVGAMWDTHAGQTRAGSAYIFRDDGAGNWQQLSKLTAHDAEAEDSFGATVAISGNTAIVGALFEDEYGDSSGAAYLYRDDGAGNWPQLAKLIASDATMFRAFGYSVDIDGNTAVVGAVGANAAYVFRETMPGTWSEIAKLTPSDGFPVDTFGTSVTIDGSRVLVGSMRHGEDSNDAGAAYLFHEFGPGDWRQVSKLVSSSPSSFENLGISVALDGRTALAGAWHDENRGSVYAYQVIPEPASLWLLVWGGFVGFARVRK
jgi:hypothetical protein